MLSLLGEKAAEVRRWWMRAERGGPARRSSGGSSYEACVTQLETKARPEEATSPAAVPAAAPPVAHFWPGVAGALL